MLTRILTLIFFTISIVTFSQKRAITHDDYDLWKVNSDVKISNKGKLVVSEIELLTKRGDGHIEIYNTVTDEKFTFPRGYHAAITEDERYVIFKQKVAYDSIRQEKKKEVKKENRAKEKLFVYDALSNRIIDSIVRVKKYDLPKKNSDWLVIEKYKEEKRKDSVSENTAKDSIVETKTDSLKKKVKLAYKQPYALVYHLKTKSKDTIHQIKEYALPESGNSFLFSLKNSKKEEKDIGIYKYDIIKKEKISIDTTQYQYSKLAVDNTSDQFAYIAASDSTHTDSLKHQLFYYRENTLRTLVDTLGSNIKNGWILSKNNKPYFSKSGKRLYFSSKPEPKLNRDTTKLDDELPEVDVWTWKDKILQPEQKVREEELEAKAFLSYFDTKNNTYVQLQNNVVENLIFDKEKEQPYIIGTSNASYAISRSWEWPWAMDFYSINSATGETKPILEKARHTAFISSKSSYALYFDMEKQHWFSIDLKTGSIKDLTGALSVSFHDEDDDHPALAFPHGFGGFDSSGNALVYDKYDVWKLTLDGSRTPENISKTGRLDNTTYRVLNLDKENPDLASYLKDELLLTSFDRKTKASGLYTYKRGKLKEKIKPSKFYLQNYTMAKNAPVLTYTKENFQVYPDTYVTKDGFKSNVKITNLNPHEKDFKWGTVEQFSWNAYDGTKLDGLIYKPENFDANKKYPMITYFYEKRSDNYTRHSTPNPSRSIVNPTYLVSNEYVMFVPDIVYKDGKPGESAYNCIVSGIEAVEKLGYVDSDNLALQGQSWGGYQVAYLVTKINKFKAAMAGAPVSNMTSAYGGIRWGSGLSRAFQYERSQTRIGKDLWEGLDLYIENSPLFGVPNIETPLLMMHNDEDGAVPYYQGIEMFMAMRRLQKPAWLLVYNKEAHNLTQIKNRQDLSIRMMQFFDHYLKGAPAPLWMTEGLPRVKKGKDLGYELEGE
ncbi:alpha/beta hydrolase family protein [Maribacter sp. 2210JD10-5]|uniref:alpha/beta hydrolase family protein n=1 Tax=Maribacter sp. 2210JD10-5 TaxID=3386272 RepID=UPI0039BCF5AD